MGNRTIYTNAIAFPATQTQSSDPNTLDDYEEGTWTPVLTFETPGDVARTVATALGWYTKTGNQVDLWWNLNYSNFTHTTASGNLIITGVPIAPSADASGYYAGSMVVAGITKAGYTQFNPVLAVSTPIIYFFASGSGAAYAQVAFGDVPTGTQKVFRGHISYRT